NHVEVFVPAKAEAQGQSASGFPVILKIKTKLLGGNKEVWVAIGDGHAGDETRSGEALWVSCGVAENCAGVFGEVDLQCGAEFEEATFDGVPDVVGAALEGVLADGFGEVILELPFALERLLRNVGVGAERRVRENDERSADAAVDDVVPELVAEG